VDFYATRGLRSLYIQVTADIANADTREREIRPYFKLNDQVKKILVVNRPIGETLDENGFSIIGIADFLLSYIR
jgi:predicted AAA+ superfamily ATPase